MNGSIYSTLRLTGILPGVKNYRYRHQAYRQAQQPYRQIYHIACPTIIIIQCMASMLMYLLSLQAVLRRICGLFYINSNRSFPGTAKLSLQTNCLKETALLYHKCITIIKMQCNAFGKKQGNIFGFELRSKLSSVVITVH